MKRSNLLLKVTSVIFIVYSVISILAALVGLYFSITTKEPIQYQNTQITSGIFMAVAITLGLNGIAELLAGIYGIKANNLTVCTILSIVVIGLSVVSFVSAIFDGTVTWESLVSVIICILYYKGVSMKYKS